jgi:hypothetical protein
MGKGHGLVQRDNTRENARESGEKVKTNKAIREKTGGIPTETEQKHKK